MVTSEYVLWIVVQHSPDASGTVKVPSSVTLQPIVVVFRRSWV